LCALFVHGAWAQSCPSDIRGGWEGELPVSALFDITIELYEGADGEFTGRLASPGVVEDVDVWQDRRGVRMQSERAAVAFEGRLSADADQVDGFVDYASNLYRVRLHGQGQNRWSGKWSPLPLVEDSVDFDLYFDDDGAGGTGGYFFFRDDRLPSLYGLGARCSGRRVEVREKNLGLTFVGEFDDKFSELRVTVSAPGGNSTIVFTPMSAESRALSPGTSAIPPLEPGENNYAGSAPEETGDGWRTAPPLDLEVRAEPLREVVTAVARGELPKTHSILVARSGYLIFEEYFYGFDRDMLHDMRSASKSLASTLIGLAVDRKLIDGSAAKVLPFFPEYRSYRAWDQRKLRISLRDLMTMSSGLDANDSDPVSVASERAYQSQSIQPDWIKLSLDAPMIADPGTRVLYGGANPLVLGGILDNVVAGRVEWFAEDALFRPLGINNYRIFMDPMGIPYMGGGMYLRPRDMLKIGQMYLDGGQWQGRQVLSGSWVTESFGKYGRLEPLERNGNEYGYLWWHENYVVDGRRLASIEARGNGGQYIFVVPELDLAAVITAGNYRGGLAMTRQPQEIFQRFVLPAVVH
jgi:CubicO group peptidase (beta-lactamase class C family)